MGYERVNILELEHVVRFRAWASGGHTHWRYRRVCYGTHAGGWFAQRVGQAWSGVWLVPDERAACDLITRWMAAGEWQRTPATYDGRQQPVDGGTWFLSGNQWVLGEPVEGFTGKVVRNGGS